MFIFYERRIAFYQSQALRRPLAKFIGTCLALNHYDMYAHMTQLAIRNSHLDYCILVHILKTYRNHYTPGGYGN